MMKTRRKSKLQISCELTDRKNPSVACESNDKYRMEYACNNNKKTLLFVALFVLHKLCMAPVAWTCYYNTRERSIWMKHDS